MEDNMEATILYALGRFNDVVFRISEWKREYGNTFLIGGLRRGDHRDT